MSTTKETRISTTPVAELHPFDHLTADEIVDVATITRQAKPDVDFVFNTITQKEPNKKEMLSYLGWDTSKPRVTKIEREALVVALEKKTMKVYEGIVSLTHRTLKSWAYVPDVQPILTMDEMFDVEELVIKDPKVHQECRELGITDMSNVFADPWAIARHVAHPGREKRMMQALMYMRTCEDDNQYAHPLDFVPIVGK
jgi:primary-amine oxidase